MKRFTFLTILLLIVSLASVLAFEVDVLASSQEEVTLSFTGFNEIVRVDSVSATVETASVSDTYLVDSKLALSGDRILLIVDVTDPYEDYDSGSITGIIISGNIDGEPFAKRISSRSTSAPLQLAPSVQQGIPNYIYWVIGLALAIIAIVLAYLVFTAKPNLPKRKSRKKTRRSSTSKKKVKKRKKVKKKKVKKKNSKRKKSSRRK